MKARNLILGLLLLSVAVIAGIVGSGLGRQGAAPLLSNALALPIPGSPDSLAITMSIENRAGPDTLLSAHSTQADSLSIIGGVSPDGLPIPADAAPSLAADGAYIRLDGPSTELVEGQLIPIVLVFDQAGEVSTRARVISLERSGTSAHAFHDGAINGLEVASESAPRISMRLSADGPGWVARFELENIELSSDKADGPHEAGFGHGHVYLGGLKLQRLYSPEIRIGALPAGSHELRATLNTNDHRSYLVDGAPVASVALIDAR